MFRWGMTRLELDNIAAALLAAAGWARVGLTDPKEHLRIQSAKELAQTILDCAERSPEPHPDQLTLSL